LKWFSAGYTIRIGLFSFLFSRGAKFGCCLLPNTCLGIAIQIISRKESSQIGMKWEEIGRPPSVDDDFSLGNCLGVLIFDCIIFAFLTW